MAFDDGVTATFSEEDIRQKVLREREAADAERSTRDRELEEESVQLDKEIEEEIRGTTMRISEDPTLLISL